jgi:hypothetical protein
VRLRGIIFLLLGSAFALVVRAQELLTLEQTLDRARKRAPLILAAQDRIEEARGRLLGAKVLLRDNPVLSFSGGPRYTPGSDLLDSEVGLSQSFELGGRRRSRIAGAQADVDREAAASRNAARQLLGDVSIAFWQAVAAREQVRLSGKANQVALELRDSMQKPQASCRAIEEGEIYAGETGNRLEYSFVLSTINPRKTSSWRGSQHNTGVPVSGVRRRSGWPLCM